MIKLLIVDDEPLVCIGLQSMLNWVDYDIEIIGTARNGQIALEMIEAQRPDIVISDIKMPVKNGLELARECNSRFGRVPLFILLTSYEEFDYVREAIRLQTVDYLVKIELDADTLSAAIVKAIAVLQQHRQEQAPAQAMQRSSIMALREKFFIRLLNNLFDSDEERLQQMEGLDIRLADAPFAVASFALHPPMDSPDAAYARYASALQVVRETLGRYFAACHIVTLDLWYFSVVMEAGAHGAEDREAYVRDAAAQTVKLLHNYLSIGTHVGIGPFVEELRMLPASYQISQRCCHQATDAAPIQAGGLPQYAAGEADAGLQEVLIGIRRALEEADATALDDRLAALSGLMQAYPGDFLTAMDTACNVLYMALSLLPEGEAVLQEAFAAFPEGYRALHHLRTVGAIMDWLQQLHTGCVAYLAAQSRSARRQVIESVKAYIDKNIDKRITLQEVASVFNFSPNYLSQLFAKHTGEGFVEYITLRKIKAAKDMLRQGDSRIYEIAQRLGFESSFYFSKVFKKVEGISPREYQQRYQL